MIQFKNLKIYTQLVNGILFPQNVKNPFALIYFSENSTLVEDYHRLNLRLIDFRIVVTPYTRLPISKLTPELKKSYKNIGLLSYQDNYKIPSGKNIIIDLTQYTQMIDKIYNPSNYRQRPGFFIDSIIQRTLNNYPNYNKIFMYSIDVEKEFNKSFIDRKIFPIIKNLKDEKISLNNMLLATIDDVALYRLLISDSKYKFERTLIYLKNIRKGTQEQEEDEEISKSTETVIQKLDKSFKTSNHTSLKYAIHSYLGDKEDEHIKVKSNDIKSGDAERIALTSLLYRLSGNLDKSEKIVKNIEPTKRISSLKAIDKYYTDQLLTKKPAVSLTTDLVVSSYNIPELVDKKSPAHLFEKRKIDFETNLKNDLINSFKVLEARDIPLKLQSIEIVNKPSKETELYPSDLSVVNVILTDNYKNIHKVNIEIPRIDPDSGMFRLNGQKKCLINQIIQCPITFPKPGESRFESSYAVFRITSKKLRNENFLEIKIGNFKLPLSIVCFYSFGFERTLKEYGISYTITDIQPKKQTKFFVKLDNSKYIIFTNIDSKLKERFIHSFVRTKISTYDIKDEFGTTKYFESLIIGMTGRRNSTFVITSNLQNIVDPVAKQVLISMQLPFQLEYIIKYMSEKCVDGYVIMRNDLSNQRVRNSEVLVQLAQKQILSAYTVYREQVLNGNTKASYVLNPTKVNADFNRTELSMSIEYANPIEEMSTITRVSPVGKQVSGIPDKRAITLSGRNIHDTYFGNIDTLDTPEGENIGIVQQLAIDAQITSARGIIHKKEISNKEYSGMLSTTTCMIPFLENNDGARIIMASNQAKQMLPLKNQKPPIVMSGYESLLTQNLSNSFIKKSPCDGKVTSVTNEEITILCKDKESTTIDITPVHLKSGSGKNTLSIFRTLVKEGQSVKQNQIIAEGSCVSNGSISLGRTLCVAYMPYKGYNFEDGIIINEKLIEEESLTSVHGIEKEILISPKDRILFIEQLGAKTIKGNILLRKTPGEVEELIGFVEEEDALSYGGQIVYPSPGGRIVDIEVFCNEDSEKYPILKTLINRTDRKYHRQKSKKYTTGGVPINGLVVKFRIEQEMPIGLGDKLTNRYGAKGIISLIEKDSLMPRTPTGDRIDIILNPIGIIGRMNIGQLYELYCGLISKEMANQISKINKKDDLISFLNNTIGRLDNTQNKKMTKYVLAKISSMKDNVLKQYINEVISTGFYPIVVPPFKAPNYKDVMKVMKFLKLQNAYNLYLPEYGIKTRRPVPYGYMYIAKLEHIGSEKIYVRSTGKVIGKTRQPTSGKSNEGGQRLGEMDSLSYLSYNCQEVLAEFLGPLSDDIQTKDEIISEIIATGRAGYKNAKFSPARDLLESYFIGLMLERG